MNGVKRLTPPQSRKVNALVRRTCCNYDNGNYLCIALSAFMGTLNTGCGDPALLPAARKSAKQIAELLKNVKPFSYPDVTDVDKRLDRVFSEESLANANAYYDAVRNGTLSGFVSSIVIMIHAPEECTVTMTGLVTIGIIVVHATEESGTALANLLAFGIIMIDLPEQVSCAVPFLFHM